MKQFFIKMANHYVRHSGILSSQLPFNVDCPICSRIYEIYDEYYSLLQMEIPLEERVDLQ